MKYILNLLLAVLYGCGPLVEVDNRGEIAGDMHPEVIPYVQEFESIWGRRVYGMPIRMVASLPTSIGGVCEMRGDRAVMIAVNQQRWQAADDLWRKLLIFHEMGHCQLGRAHDNRKYGDQADSIMYPNLNAVLPFFKDNEEHYISELFGSDWVYP